MLLRNRIFLKMFINFYFIVSIFLLNICAKFGFCQHPEVNTTSGILIGITNIDVHSFFSVRYGQAPIGDLRYQYVTSSKAQSNFFEGLKFYASV